MARMNNSNLNITQYRDLSLIDLGKEKLVLACDTSASIGEKTNDQLRVNAGLTAAFCLRVCLMEILAFGAEPILLINLFNNEYLPTGKEMLKAMAAELKLAKLAELPQTGSTEENMSTSMTALGIALLAKYNAETCLWHKAETGDLIIQTGESYVGADVLPNKDKILTYDDIYYLHTLPFVKEIVPVGSHGALFEAETLAKVNKLEFKANEDPLLQEQAQLSGGPATSAVVAITNAPDNLKIFKQHFPAARILGELEN